MKLTRKLSHRAMIALVFLALMVLLPVAASAATADGDTMPWDQGLTVIMNALSGNTVKIIGVILIIGAGVMLAVTQGGAVKMIAWIVIGLGIAFNAASFLSMMFGNASGYELHIAAKGVLVYFPQAVIL